jgi:predicted metal-dependent phosphoesterase TrpH
MRLCLVTPFPWSKPHEVNDHVAGIAAAFRRRGHVVTVLAPSTRAGDLVAGRRALQSGRLDDVVVALSPAVAVSPRASVGLPVGVRASLRTALERGSFDVVHAFEPAVQGLAHLALLEAESTTVASFLDATRLSYPPRKQHRDRLLARVDVLVASSEEVATAASSRFPGAYSIVPLGVAPAPARGLARRRLVVVETSAAARGSARSVLRALRELPDWEAVVLRTSALAARPAIPPSLHGRVRVRTAASAETQRAALERAAILVPAPGGSERLRLEAQAAGCALADPPGLADQPELAAAAVLRLAEGGALDRPSDPMPPTFDEVAELLEQRYVEAGARRRTAPRREADQLGGRDWIVVDLHMHTSHSHDCSIEVADLLDHAEAEGLGAIAVTDHNVFAGALEAVRLARGRALTVIPGEEVKTDSQGEVIGLFLREEIPRGMTFADTIAAIREQDGIVYVPHPFDRLHAIPSPETLHRHLPDIDVLEVYNARLLFESFNDEALRFARKYGLLAGAGSDAHVLQGVGTGALRMRRFEGPEEFLLSLRTAEVLRRPKSLAYLQSLKWVAQVKEKVR